MSHYCICPKCNKKFDRDKIQAVIVSARRYGHATCYPDNTNFVKMEVKKSTDPDLVKLKEYITSIYGESANWPMIMKQITRFTKEKGYSYSGIEKSLHYFYEIKKGNVKDGNGGIGIVEYCYQDAYNYYLAIFMAQQANESVKFERTVREIKIAPPQPRIRKKLFNNIEGDIDYE